jgi:hypothetical protein
MRVSVVCLRRAGRVVPRWQVHRAERVVGELRVEEQLDPALYRYTRVARVVDPQHRPTDRLPPLIDATLLWVRGGRMAITGFERLAGLGDQTDYAQTWLCEEPDGERSFAPVR